MNEFTKSPPLPPPSGATAGFREVTSECRHRSAARRGIEFSCRVVFWVRCLFLICCHKKTKYVKLPPASNQSNQFHPNWLPVGKISLFYWSAAASLCAPRARQHTTCRTVNQSPPACTGRCASECVVTTHFNMHTTCVLSSCACVCERRAADVGVYWCSSESLEKPCKGFIVVVNV